MKKLLMGALSCAMVFGCFSQTIEQNENGVYETITVLEFEGMSKADIFSKSVEWVALNYKNADKVTKLQDSNSGKIILKGNFSTDLYLKQGWINHTMIIECKDGKMRVTFTNFSYFSTGSGEIEFEKPMMSKKKAIEETERNVKLSLASIEQLLTSKSTADDW
jgi:hypothetical protein